MSLAPNLLLPLMAWMVGLLHTLNQALQTVRTDVSLSKPRPLLILDLLQVPHLGTSLCARRMKSHAPQLPPPAASSLPRAQILATQALLGSLPRRLLAIHLDLHLSRALVPRTTNPARSTHKARSSTKPVLLVSHPITSLKPPLRFVRPTGLLSSATKALVPIRRLAAETLLGFLHIAYLDTHPRGFRPRFLQIRISLVPLQGFSVIAPLEG